MKKKKLINILLIGAGIFSIYYIMRKNKASNNVDDDKLIEEAVEFIIPLEGFNPKAFWDYKQYTNGYGTKAKSESEVIDKNIAKERLKQEVKKNLEYLKKKEYYTNLNKNKKISLLSFLFNVGNGGLNNTGLDKTLRGNYTKESIEKEFQKWIYAGGKVLEGLVKRRQKEYNKFIS